MENETPNFYMVAEGDEEERYEFLRHSTPTDLKYFDIIRPALEPEITLKAMADMLDYDAENHNAHDFVGSHFSLAALLLREVGEETAVRIFKRLSRYGGLHGMEGVCGCGDPDTVKKELGIGYKDGDNFFEEPTP